MSSTAPRARDGKPLSGALLGLLVDTSVPEDPLVVGVDETLKRRWGKKKIAAKGIYRDPVHSGYEHFVKASGAPWWVCLMLLVPVPGLPGRFGSCPS